MSQSAVLDTRNSMIGVYQSVVANVSMEYALSLINVIVSQDGLVILAMFVSAIDT